MKVNSIWASEEFTKREAMVRTVTFELIPTQATQKALADNKTLLKDQEIYDLRDKLIPHLDVFYRRQIDECLPGADLDWGTLYTLYLSRNDSKEAERAFFEAQEEYITRIAGYLEEQSKGLYDYAFLSKTFPEFVIKHPDLFEHPDDVLKMVDATKGLGSVFINYFLTRKHILTGEKKNSVAFRVVSDNFPIYAANIRKYERIKSEAPEQIQKVEDSLDIPIQGAFIPENFGRYMGQDGIDRYNFILGGSNEPEKKGKQGLNSILHEYNQKERSAGTNHFLPQMDKLAKQILGTQGTAFSFGGFQTDQELMQQLLSLSSAVKESGVVSNAVRLFSRLDYMQKEGIYLSPVQQAGCGQRIAKDYALFKGYVKEDLIDKALEEKGKKSLTKAELASTTSRAEKAYASMQDLDRYLTDAIKTGRVTEYSHKDLSSHLTDRVVSFATDAKRSEEAFLAEEYSAESFRVTSKDKKIIKDYLDALLDLYRFLKEFKADLSEKEIIETEFYDQLEVILESLSSLVLIYNRSRNYLTRKPKDMAKKKQTCLGKTSLFSEGWVTKDPDNLKKANQCILRKDGVFYYGTFSDAAGSRNAITVHKEHPAVPCYEKIVTSAITKAYMNIPRLAFPKDIRHYFEAGNTEPYVRTEGVTEPFSVTYDIYNTYLAKWYIKGFYDKEKDEAEREKKKQLFREELTKMIRFYKDFLAVFYKTKEYPLERLKAAESYENIADFFNDCESVLTDMSLGYIEAEKLEELEQAGVFYLFQIHSQTLYGKNSKNYYAKYFEFLLSDENLKTKQIFLNGAPMINYRPAALEKKITHPAGSMVVNKKTINGAPVPEEIHKELYAYYNGRRSSLSPDAQRYKDMVSAHKTPQDLIKNRRYTREMYSLSIATTLNFDATEKKQSLNECVDAFIKEGKCNILSVIRGERDLLYYMLSDPSGKILEQGSLNEIDGFDFQEKLYYMSKDNVANRKNWQSIEKTADVKEGYLSAAISKIVRLALKNNAIILIEGFMDKFLDKRSCLDNQVYKKFESMLLKRLSCLHLPDVDATEPGGIANPLQLADLNRQNAVANGILFKANTAYTATLCPATGFLNLFDFNGCKTVKARREFLKKMDEIYFDAGRGVFVFRFHYSKMDNLKTPYARDEWIVNTSGQRYNKGKSGYEEYDITANLAATLNDCHIPYKNGEDLLEAVNSDATGGIFINALMDAFVFSMQTRSYPGGFDSAVIFHSPAENAEGECFDTTEAPDSMPQCAEAVKAYNLTDKLIFSIQLCQKANEKKISIAKAEEWIKYRQNR